jgi:hypothetical protein
MRKCRVYLVQERESEYHTHATHRGYTRGNIESSYSSVSNHHGVINAFGVGD